MAQLIVRNIDDTTRDRLRERAKRRGHSLEQEVRDILRAATIAEGEATHQPGLGTRIAARFKDIGLRDGEEFETPPRNSNRVVTFDP